METILQEINGSQASTVDIYDISAYNDVLATVGERKVQVRNCSDGRFLHSTTNHQLSCVAVSDELIVMGGVDFTIYVHQIKDGYKLLRASDLRKFHDIGSEICWIEDISFLNADVIMVLTTSAGIFFISFLFLWNQVPAYPIVYQKIRKYYYSGKMY